MNEMGWGEESKGVSRITPQFCTLATRWTVVTVTEMEAVASGYQVGGGTVRVLFRHAEAEMPTQHPSGNAEQAFIWM